MKKIATSLFIAVLTVLSVTSIWAQQQVDGVYQIGSMADLTGFATLVNGGAGSAAAVLTADVDMQGQEWTGMTGYTGTFDGNGKCIKNLGAPLFLLTGNGVTIKNLTLEGAISREEGANFGAFVADHQGTNLTLENCVNKTDVTAPASANVGGFVGRLYNGSSAATYTFTGCVNEGDVTGGDCTGGFVGYDETNNTSIGLYFTNCTNNGDVTGAVGAGGYFGQSHHAEHTSHSCNNGNITSTIEGAGGIAGYVRRSQQLIESFVNTGAISAPNSAGGFVGAEWRSSAPQYVINIRDSYNTGAVTVTDNSAGGFVGKQLGTSASYTNVYNSWNSGKISGGESAAFMGHGKISRFHNCFNTGDVEGTSTSSVFLGWAEYGFEAKNCWSIGEVSGMDAGRTQTLYRKASMNGSIANSYDLANLANNPENGRPDGYEDEWLANGHLCYILNGDQSDVTWYQALGTDTIPFPSDKGHQRVYQVAEKQCDGTPKEGADISFSNSDVSPLPDHVYGVNGVCQNCHKYGVAPQKDAAGVYQITNAGNLVEFAHIVNDGETGANAVVTAPIDLSCVIFKPIGTSNQQYSGTFDGGMQPITNVSEMLFGHIAGATISNVALASGQINVSTDNSCGSIVGFCNVESTLSHSYSYVSIAFIGNGDSDAGGLVGPFCGTIKDSYYVGSLKGGQNWAGSGIAACGINPSKPLHIVNCMSIVDLTEFNGKYSGAICGYPYTSTLVENCIYKEPEGGSVFGGTSGTSNNTSAMSEEAIASGAATWKLNGGTFADAVFYQTLGTDTHPVLDATHGLVFKTSEAYVSVFDDNLGELIGAIQAEGEKYLFENPAFEDGELVAQNSLVESYKAQLDALASIASLEALMEAYAELQAEKDLVQASADVYLTYIMRAQEVRSEIAAGGLDEGSLGLLNAYMENSSAPDATFPNGTYGYIMDTHQLDVNQLNEEIAFLETLYSQAVLTGYMAGANITSMLVNPLFKDDFSEGWEGVMATGKTTQTLYTSVDSIATVSVTAAESYSTAPFDMHQTLHGLKPGLYLLRMNAAQRPSTSIDPYSLNYTSQIYANANNTYVGAAIEFAVSAADAIDGITANLTGEQPDLDAYVNDANAFIVNRAYGMAVATNAGRCMNYILANVAEGDSLTVGIRNLGTGQGTDWTGFANTNLTYLGAMDGAQAGAGLDLVLEGQVARATAILYEYISSSGGDYAVYPNFSTELKDGLEAAIRDANAAIGNAEKYALVQRFSDLFMQIYSCKMVYADLIRMTELVQNVASQMINLVDSATFESFYQLYDDLQYGYEDGTYSEQEAKKALETDIMVPYLPTETVDGTLVVASREQMVYVAALVSALNVSPDVKVVADIDMSGVNYMGIGNTIYPYAGTFDGGGHKFSNLLITREGETRVGLINYLKAGAVARNFVLDSTCSITGRSIVGAVGGIAAGSGTALIEKVGNEGNIHILDDGAGGILGQGYDGPVFILNCYSTGQVTNEGTGLSNGAIAGWYGNYNGISNCWSTATVQNPVSGKYLANYGSCIITNCFDELAPVNQTRLESGEITFKLNEGQDEVVWFQTLGEDSHPVFDRSHKSVILLDDGTYANGADEVETVHTSQPSVRGAIYDLSGRRVEKVAKGIYVVNGKKLLVR